MSLDCIRYATKTKDVSWVSRFVFFFKVLEHLRNSLFVIKVFSTTMLYHFYRQEKEITFKGCKNNNNNDKLQIRILLNFISMKINTFHFNVEKMTINMSRRQKKAKREIATDFRMWKSMPLLYKRHSQSARPSIINLLGDWEILVYSSIETKRLGLVFYRKFHTFHLTSGAH